MRNIKKWIAVLIAAAISVPTPVYAAPQIQSEAGTHRAEATASPSDAVVATASLSDAIKTTADLQSQSPVVKDHIDAATASNATQKIVYSNEVLSAEDDIIFNTGTKEIRVVKRLYPDDEVEEDYDENVRFFDEDGSYTIELTETNPFFPYEVQFSCDGDVREEWFLTPESTVQIGEHIFEISTPDNEYSSMTLNVGGEEIRVYPEKKVFTNQVKRSKRLMKASGFKPSVSLELDLSEYSPIELTMVSVDSIFSNGEVVNPDKVIWANTQAGGIPDYSISQSGDLLDLSWYTYYGCSYWDIIIGEVDQLAAINADYRLKVNVAESGNWLTGNAWSQNEEGKHTELSINNTTYHDFFRSGNRSFNAFVNADELGDNQDIYFALSPTISGSRTREIRVFKGLYKDASEAERAEDITSLIWRSDMTQSVSGYLIQSDGYMEDYITMVAYDAEGDVCGCLPIDLHFSIRRSRIRVQSVLDKNGEDVLAYTSSSIQEDGGLKYNLNLYKGESADQEYILNLSYISADNADTYTLSAYRGTFSSEKEAAGTPDISSQLFATDENGYMAVLKNETPFTVFVNKNEQTDIYHISVIAKESDRERMEEDPFSDGTAVKFKGFLDEQGHVVSAFTQGNGWECFNKGTRFKSRSFDKLVDSYTDNNYIIAFVFEDADLTKLAPLFECEEGVNLYSPGSSTPEISGGRYYDFSNGAIQFTAGSESMKYQQNYWLIVLKPSEGSGIYINSFDDPEAETKTEKGVIYSTREVLLDSAHDDYHDILVINRGEEPIKEIRVELECNQLELNEYWTLKGVYELPGVSYHQDTYGTQSENQDDDLDVFSGRIRLRAKSGVQDGTDIDGKLYIKSGNNTLCELKLTGTIGDPSIITEDIPNAVLYVPYGTMLQNSNKYKKNTPTYELVDGNLPEGMTVRQNGEIYGVPKETGTFTFTVEMTNSYPEDSFDEKEFTLTVVDNEDANVDGATDTGYDLKERVPYIISSNDSVKDYLMVSEGVYDEFTYIFLDGEKLNPGTDFNSESGSTRITLQAETLKKVGEGRHTLGIEFRTKENHLQRAAQNYYISERRGSGNRSKDSSGSSESDDSSENTSSYSATANKRTGYRDLTQSLSDGTTCVPGKGRTERAETPGQWIRNNDGSYEYHGQNDDKWTGWIVYNHFWYYMDENGRMLIGWQYIGGHWYFFCTLPGEHYGELLTGWQLLGGRFYYFSEKDDSTMGQLFVNAMTPDGYMVDQEGAWDGKGLTDGVA